MLNYLPICISNLFLLAFLTKEFVDPLRLVWAPAKFTRSHVDHTASTDSGRTGSSQVLDLEEHAHFLSQLYTLTISEAKCAVVIKHRVHVLDP